MSTGIVESFEMDKVIGKYPLMVAFNKVSGAESVPIMNRTNDF